MVINKDHDTDSKDGSQEKIVMKQTKIGKDGKVIILKNPENESIDGNGRWIKGQFNEFYDEAFYLSIDMYDVCIYVRMYVFRA